MLKCRKSHCYGNRHNTESVEMHLEKEKKTEESILHGMFGSEKSLGVKYEQTKSHSA